jgi:tyrosyl-tRNA synthetase
LDGRKMSSSWGNTINLTDTPHDMYGKVMSLRDELVLSYFEYCTRVPMDEVRVMQEEVANGSLHPRDAKMRLAREMVVLYHGTDAGNEAEQAFVHTFQAGKLPEDIAEHITVTGATLADVLIETGLVASKSEWRRLVLGGGVHVVGDGDDRRIEDVDATVQATMTLKIGKRRFVRVVVE